MNDVERLTVRLRKEAENLGVEWQPSEGCHWNAADDCECLSVWANTDIATQWLSSLEEAVARFPGLVDPPATDRGYGRR